MADLMGALRNAVRKADHMMDVLNAPVEDPVRILQTAKDFRERRRALIKLWSLRGYMTHKQIGDLLGNETWMKYAAFQRIRKAFLGRRTTS